MQESIYFNNSNIIKYIQYEPEKGHTILIVEEYSFRVTTVYDDTVNSHIDLVIDYKKLEMMEKIIKFFISNNCFFYCGSNNLYKIDKNLFLLSGYFISKIDDKNYFISKIDDKKKSVRCIHRACDFLLLSFDVNFLFYLKKMIKYPYNIYFDIEYNLLQIDFIINTCKEEQISEDLFNSICERIIISITNNLEILVDIYGLELFKSLKRNNLLDLFIGNCRKKNTLDYVSNLCLQYNQPEIIDFLFDLELHNKQICLNENDYDLLTLHIKNDNIETFTYIITKIKIDKDYAYQIILNSAEYISKEHIDVLFNNNFLDLEKLKLLKKSIKNNPDRKLKKYIKNLIEDLKE